MMIMMMKKKFFDTVIKDKERFLQIKKKRKEKMMVQVALCSLRKAIDRSKNTYEKND